MEDAPEEASQSDGGVEEAGSSEQGGGGEGSSQAVQKLCRFLRHQQEVVYKEENVSKYFPPATQKVASKCWEQIHSNIATAIEGKYGCVLEEWSIGDKLTELDRQRRQHPASHPAWRPTGIPADDSLTVESAEATQVLPELETKLAEAQVMSCDLEHQLREREAELAQLELEITTSLDTLKQTLSSLTPTTPTQ